MSKRVVFWFRRDLRLEDNAGLYFALKNNSKVLPLFIFDTDILYPLDRRDARVHFIHQAVSQLKDELQQHQSDLMVRTGRPIEVFKQLVQDFPFSKVYTNQDYEPSAVRRDQEVEKFLKSQGIEFCTHKDQVLFEKDEILTGQGKPYTVYTPYKKKVLEHLSSFYLQSYPNQKYFNSFDKTVRLEEMIGLKDLGFEKSDLVFPGKEISVAMLKNYQQTRDFPALPNGTSRLGIHFRFGTISPRVAARLGKKYSSVWLSELIWRDFFMQILWHYPHVVKSSFRPEYDKIAWRNSKGDFERWCAGETGYPLVDAGMRELNATGYMHNRVRMVVGSFLTKHLLIHWLKGERYFASKLLDYDLAANNGNWQWVAGSGCDAAPYFRIFNPQTQLQKFDPDLEYVKKWVPELNDPRYAKPIIDHNAARERCLREYAKALK